jgi:catechol 2,3-dioxygenase-like lactoylglutathione lyase family enzyme
MNIRRIVPDLSASDLEACKSFYTNVLGLKLAMDLGWVMSFVSPSNPTAQLTILSKDQTAMKSIAVSIQHGVSSCGV